MRGRRWTPSCSAGRGWSRSGPATSRGPWGVRAGASRGAGGDERAAGRAAAGAGARHPAGGDRELAENALGRELRELPPDLRGLPTALRSDLSGTTTRVGLARRFYNDAVRDTHALRRRRLTRLLRLHGSRPMPRFFDIDDRLEGASGGVDAAGRGVR